MGLDPVGSVDFAKVLRHVHDVIDAIPADESPAQLAREGIDLVRGWARLAAPDALDVDGRTLRGSRLVLATGASASIPPIDGLDTVPYLDNGPGRAGRTSRSHASSARGSHRTPTRGRAGSRSAARRRRVCGLLGGDEELLDVPDRAVLLDALADQLPRWRLQG